MTIDAILIQPNLSIREAIKKLNETARQILLVVDKKKRLLGTVTDGDIRRAIIKGISLDSSVKKIMNPNPKILKIGYSKKEAEEMFVKYGIKRIPVINPKGQIIDLLFIEDFVEKKTLPKENIVVIMAGGRGKRLDPLTRIIPKPLIPIGDKSMIEHIMERFAEQGFRKFILTLHYKKEMIKMYIKDLNLPYEIDWVEEEEPLGTAGGLSLVFEKYRPLHPVIVTNCDIIMDVNFEKILNFHSEKNAVLTIIGTLISTKISYGILKIKDGYLEKLEEKPSYDILVNSGVYIIDSKILAKIPRKFMDMPEVISNLQNQGEKIIVYPHYGQFLDIGQWKLYKELIAKF